MSHRPSPAVMDAVEDIMRVYRTLPPRPTLEEVEAAMSVLRTAAAEEEAKLEALSHLDVPPDVPEELVAVLKEVKRNAVLLQGYEQRREANHVVEMEKRIRVLDELIQRASRLVSGEEREDGREKRDGGGVGAKDVLGRSSSWKSGAFAVSAGPVISPTNFKEPEKLSLIKVASVIETAAKSGKGVLDLQGKLGDEIEWLPVSLGKLVGTTELNLSENRIMALPSTIGNLRFLTKFNVHSNQLTKLPDSIGELTSLIDLNLSSNSLRSLPNSIGNLTHLTNLDLSSNQLTLLPDSLGNLTCLRRLDVETNELEELPYTIGSCSSLVELRLDFNELRALPEAIGRLESLEILTAHYNRIKGLPTTMASLTKLKELDVSFNEVESIPESLCLVTSLVKLNIGNNFANLWALPKSIGNLEMLEELNISNNQIRVLPESFKLLSKLRVLYIDETPLEVPPREVSKLGAQAVVKFMADLAEAKDQVDPRHERSSGFWSWLLSVIWPCTKPSSQVEA